MVNKLFDIESCGKGQIKLVGADQQVRSYRTKVAWSGTGVSSDY